MASAQVSPARPGWRWGLVIRRVEKLGGESARKPWVPIQDIMSTHDIHTKWHIDLRRDWREFAQFVKILQEKVAVEEMPCKAPGTRFVKMMWSR